MTLKPLIDWFTRKKREQLQYRFANGGDTIIIRQGLRQVRLSHSDYLLLTQIKGCSHVSTHRATHKTLP